MPRDASGLYTLPAGNPVITNTVISSVWANTTLSDIAAQLNNVFTRDGLLGPTGPFKIADGTVAAPGLAWNAEPGLGWYRPSANSRSFAVAGAGVESINAQAAVTFVSYWPRATGPTQITLFDQPSTSPNYTQFYFRTEAATHIIAESRGGTGVAKPLNVTFPQGIGLNGNVSVQGDVKINPDTGSFRFGTTGGAVNLNPGNGFPAIQFSATGTDYQLIHVRSSGDLVYQKPGSPAKNLFTVFGNETGTNFVGTVASGNEVVAATSLRATNGNCYVSGAFRTTSDAGLVFDTNRTTEYIALGDPGYGSQFQLAFIHVPGTWAGIRMIVQTAQYQYTDSGIPRATRAGPWDALVSDGRVKENIEDFTDGLDAILKLRPRRFNYIPETGIPGPQLGYVVQEADDVLPTSKATIEVEGFDDLKTLSIQPVEYMLVNAVKKLHARIAQLEGVAA